MIKESRMLEYEGHDGKEKEKHRKRRRRVADLRVINHENADCGTTYEFS